MILAILVFGLAAILASIYLFYKKRFQYWGKLGFIHTTPSIPFGDAKGIARNKTNGQIVAQVYGKFPEERMVGLWMLFKPTLLVRDPELIKSIIVRDFMSFHDRGIYVNEKADPLSASLFSIAGVKWRNLRVKLSPTFTSGKMKLMFHIFVECSKQLKDILETPADRGEVVEVKDYAARFTTDIISLAAFGLETNSLNNPDAEFRRFGQQIFEPTTFDLLKGLLLSMIPKVSQLFSIRTFRPEITDFFMKAIKQTMDYRESNNIRRNDFMDLLIQLKNKGFLDDADGVSKDGTKFTFEEAAAQAFVFFIAGFETSSTTMQFALYQLAKNPDIQQRVREECNEVLARHNGEVTYESVMEMDYLGRVIDETLRMHPPVTVLKRESNADYKIPGTDLTLPKGVQVFIDCFSLQHDPAHFPHPGRFDPERFTAEGKASRHHFAYLPFGEGPRNCIGMRFGLMQTRVGLLTLLTNFEFAVTEKTPIPMVYDPKSLVLTPKGGMHLKLTKLAK